MKIGDHIDMTNCLIVDACQDERHRVSGMLSAYGFELEQAEDAGEALARCRKEMPDVIIVSERLSDMSAFDFIKRIRSRQHDRAPIVLVYSEAADPPRIGRAIWEGASECLVQPFDAAVLDDKLRLVGLI